MRNELQARLDLYLGNLKTVKKNFTWQYSLAQHLVALLYSGENKAVSVDEIKKSRALLKQNAGAFSSFRNSGYMSIITSAMLSLAAKPEEQMQNTMTVYNQLKKEKFWGSDMLAISAYQIAADEKPVNYDDTVARARAFYKGMKEEHYFITGKNDYIFASMLALTDLEVEAGVEAMEHIYKMLKPVLRRSDSLQALSQVLVVSGAEKDVCDKVLALRAALKEKNCRMDKQYTLPMLGVLALLPGEPEAIAQDVADTYGYLRGQKGCGAWSLSKQSLLGISAGLVAYTVTEDMKNGLTDAALTANITNIILAQQAALIAIIAASAATSTAAASSH